MTLDANGDEKKGELTLPLAVPMTVSLTNRLAVPLDEVELTVYECSELGSALARGREREVRTPRTFLTGEDLSTLPVKPAVPVVHVVLC